VSERPLFIASLHCRSRAHCVACLTNPTFRQSLAPVLRLPDDAVEGVCMDPQAAITLERATELQQQFHEAAQREAPLPSLLERAKNLAGAAGRVIVAVVEGQPIEIEEVLYQERLARCRSCPSQQYRASDQTCAECGCYVRAKAALATEFCRLGYWQAQPGMVDSLVLTANLWVAQAAALLELLPAESRSAAALRSFHDAAAQNGCSGCKQRSLQAAALAAFIAEAPSLPAEMQTKVRALFPQYERIFDGQRFVSLAELSVAEQ